MPQKFLNSTEICSSLEKVRGKAVPEGVGSHLAGNGYLADSVGNQIPHAFICQSTTSLIHKEGV